MKILLLLSLLLASCGEKTYTEPAVGMPYLAFHKVCNVTASERGRGESVTNSQGSTLTITLSERIDTYPVPPTGKRDSLCVGKFTFVNDKLDSITR